MKLEHLTEGKILKYLAMFFMGLVLVTVLVVFVIKSPKQVMDELVRRGVEELLVGEEDPKDVMRVIFNGTGTPLAAQFASQSTVIAINDNIYVFDVGPRSNANLVMNMTLEPAFVKAVFISHTHSDHVGDLGQLNLASWVRGREGPLQVYGTETVQDLVDGYNLAYGPDRMHRVAHHGADLIDPEVGLMEANIFNTDDGEVLVYKDDQIEVSAFYVPHDPVTGAVGYRITCQDRSVIISGDTALMDDYSYANGADLLIHEGIFHQVNTRIARIAERVGKLRMMQIFDHINHYHTNMIDYEGEPGLLSRMEGIDVDMLVLTHIIPTRDNFLVKRKLKEFISKSPVKTIVVQDNEEIHLPIGSDDILIK